MVISNFSDSSEAFQASERSVPSVNFGTGTWQGTGTWKGQCTGEGPGMWKWDGLS